LLGLSIDATLASVQIEGFSRLRPLECWVPARKCSFYLDLIAELKNFVNKSQNGGFLWFVTAGGCTGEVVITNGMM
jgi:hypothetical protein